MALFVRILLVTGPPDEVEAAAREHREQVAELSSRGKLRQAVAFKDGRGFLELFEAADLHEAEAIARASPLVEQGLGTWLLQESEAIEFGS